MMRHLRVRVVTAAVAAILILSGLGARDVASRAVFPDRPIVFDPLGLLGARLEAAYIPSAIKSIQVASCVITNASTTGTATLTAVTTANTMLVLGGQESSDGTSELARVALTNTTQATCTRAGSSNSTTIGFTAIEFRPAVLKSIQRTTISIGGGSNSGTATVTSVSTTKSSVNFLGLSVADGGANTGAGSKWWVRLAQTNATTITATRDAGSNAWAIVVSLEVPEFY